MASMNNLLISWNFESLNASNTSNEFEVKDVSNNFSGKAIDFNSNTTLFLKKEQIKTNRKLNLETIESAETIQVLEEDDERVSELDKPSSIKLMLENSMYQNISDEMLNMFSTIDAYAFKFMEPYHKYKPEYDKLEKSRHEFFSKILEKPNLEKYIEFYKWIDSSLAYLLEQLVPETSFFSNNLKNTVESHILERNKYKHELPLTTSKQRNFTSQLKTLKNTPGAASISSSLEERYLTDNNLVYASDELDVFRVKSIYNQNTQEENFFKNYEIFQSPGKFYNHRDGKTSKSIIKTFFSFPENEKNNVLLDYEFFSHANFNYKFFTQKLILDKEEKETGTRQGSGEPQTINVSGVDYNTNNFIDNIFIQRNIPYTDENYSSQNNSFVSTIPQEKILHYRKQNIILDNNNDTYDLSQDIVDPPVQVGLPYYHIVNINNSPEDVVITSPYHNQIDTFSPRSLKTQNDALKLAQPWELKTGDTEKTVFSVLEKEREKIKIKRIAELDVVYPRKDLVGMARIRTKAAAYEEEQGSIVSSLTNMATESPPIDRSWILAPEEDFNLVVYYGYSALEELIPPDLLKTAAVPPVTKTWTANSYNKNSAFIRSIWKKDLNERKTTRGYDRYAKTGSYNCFNFPNRKSEIDYSPVSEFTTTQLRQCQKVYSTYAFNPYNSIYCMDSTSSYSINFNDSNAPEFISINVTEDIYGDLGPYNNFYLARMLTAPRDRNTNIYAEDTTRLDKNIFYPQPKPSFIHNIFHPPVEGEADTVAVINCSYQMGADCNIMPSYDSYDDFRKNIKHLSQYRSIIPEFNVSNYENIINKQENEKEYLKIYGRETEDFNQLEKEDFYLDFGKFLNKKTNSVSMMLNVVKKLLPYKGFYPQDRTVQLAGIFSDEYFNKTSYVYDTVKTGSYVDHVPYHRYLSIMQPLFMPGILFNSIKAGISVSWPVRTYSFIDRVDETNSGEYSPYSEDENLVFWNTAADEINNGGNNSENTNAVIEEIYHKSADTNQFCGRYTVKKLNQKLPFETLIDPIKHFADLIVNSEYNYSEASRTPVASFGLSDWDTPDESYVFSATGICLIYLDPTHYNPNIITDRRMNTLVKANLYQATRNYWSSVITKNYKSAINNFLAEVGYFFLKSQGVTKLSSKPRKNFKALKPGTKYVMDIIVEKSNNFSMFNKYINYEGNKNLFIPPHSLFGPPVSCGTVLTNEIFDYGSEELYLPYVPPYMRTGIAKIRVSYDAPQSSQNYQSQRIIDMEQLLADLTWEAPNFSNGTVYPTDLATSESFTKQMTLRDCLEIVINDSDRPDYNSDGHRTADSDENYKIFSIQPKFETPLLNFSKCSFVGIDSDASLEDGGIETIRAWYDLPKDPEYTK